jgi:hypothetical protein
LTGPEPVADDEAEDDGDPAAEVLLAPPEAALDELDELQPAAASGMHSSATTATLREIIIGRPYQSVVTQRHAGGRTVIALLTRVIAGGTR